MRFSTEIKVLGYSRSVWHNLEKGIEDPLYYEFLFELGKWQWDDNFSLVVTGGLLENRCTKDIDLALGGPYHPRKIRTLLLNLMGIGFKIGTRVDVKYLPVKYPTYKQWDDGGRKPINLPLYSTYNGIMLDGNMRWYRREEDGILFKSNRKFPAPKTIEYIEKNPSIIQVEPIKIK